MNCYIGIDIGTYESKGVLVNNDGEILCTKKVPHQLNIPHPGWAEHEAQKVWWENVKEIIHGIVEYCNTKNISNEIIKCIGISSIAPSVLPVDKYGNPLRNGILYGIDTRATPQMEKLNNKLGHEKIIEVSKQTLTTQAGGPKILWIKENEPAIYEKTDVFLSGAGFAIYKLTGEKAIDHYTAASFAPIYDFESNVWSEELTPHITEINKLPKIYWTTDIIGSVTDEVAAELRLNIDTKVLVATTDALSEAISCGAVQNKDLMLMYGSSTFFILNNENLVKSDKMWPNLHAVPEMYSLTGGTATAGSLTRWFIDQFDDPQKSIDERYEKFMNEASLSSITANGVICLPYFSGERTPINDPNAKGIFFGLTLRHTKIDMYRAILEGIGFSIRQNIEYMNSLGFSINRIISIGGGTKNKLLLQIVSDICGIKQVVTKNSVGASYGNAFLCSIAMNDNENLTDINKWLEIETVIEPNKEFYSAYDKLYNKYSELYENNKKLM